MEQTTQTELPALRANTIEVIRRGGGSRPDVLRVRHRGGQAILKDQNGCDRAFARLLGPLLAAREARALSALHGLAGIPSLLARPDRRSILMEDIAAKPIARSQCTDWPVFFERLDRLLDAMHERGIAHCDLRSPDNTLVDEDGRPVLVDFVASVRRAGPWNLLGRWVFASFCDVDRKAVLKLKSIVAPELVAPEQRELLEHRSPVHRSLRGVGIAVRNLTRKLFTGSV